MSTHNIDSYEEAFLMSTQNVFFHKEIRKILCGYPLLSRTMILLECIPNL